MKPFVAVLAGAAVASAAPSADPHFLYGGYGGYGLVAPAVAAVDTGLIVSPSSGAVTPDFTDAQKEANPEIAEGSEAIVHPVIVGKREAGPYYGYGGYGLFAPALATVDTGLIVSPSSGAITPDFTDAQKEEKPEIADGSEAIKGVVVVGKREAKAEPWLGLPGPWSFPGLVAHPGGAVTTDYTPAQKAAVANLVAEANRNLAGGKREAEAEPWLGLPGPWSYPGLVAHPGGAVTTDYTPAQKAAVANLVAEANRNLAGGKREAEADPWVFLHPTGANVPVAYDPATGLVTHSDGAVTPPYTADQHIAVANLAAHGLWHY